jgi:hypothetical protein
MPCAGAGFGAGLPQGLEELACIRAPERENAFDAFFRLVFAGSENMNNRRIRIIVFFLLLLNNIHT